MYNKKSPRVIFLFCLANYAVVKKMNFQMENYFVMPKMSLMLNPENISKYSIGLHDALSQTEDSLNTFQN